MDRMSESAATVTVRTADLAWLLENAKWPVDHERSCARLQPPILTAECDCAMSRIVAAREATDAWKQSR